MYPPGNPGPYGPGGYQGYGVPSTFGYTSAAMGYGGMPMYQRQQAVAAGGSSLGAGVLNFGTSTVPGIAAAGATIGGVAGSFLELGGASRFTRGLGRAMNFLDPTTLPFEAGMAGVGAGWGLGGSLASSMGYGALGTGAMRVAGAAMGGTALAAPYAAAVYGGYKAADFALSNMWQGGQNYLSGQALANQMGPSVAPGQGTRGQGMAMGSMLRDISSNTGMGNDDIARISKEMDVQKLFQTTKDMKEFRDKFTTAVKAVKEIAQLTKTSIDDAVKMFGDLRAQGFYNTSDIHSAAALTQARATTTGLGYDTMNAVGGAGSSMARQHRMRGRFGADLAQRNVASVSSALRAGMLSEEEIMEMGGVETVGLRQSEQQMSFLSSSRGRAMIAAMMGKGGAPDPSKMRGMLGGKMTLEDLVTQAAESGIGTLSKAGSRESREAMMPYAGAAMIQMAMMQQQQLYGGVTRGGTIGMLGTMGLSGQEAQALIATTANLPRQMEKDRVEQQNQLNAQAANDMQKRQSFTRKLDDYTQNAANDFQTAGARVIQNVEGRYARTMEQFFGGREYRGGDDSLLREAVKNQRQISRDGSTVSDPLFGAGVGRDLRDRYYGSSSSRSDMAKQFGGEQGLEKAIREGSVIGLGSEGLLGSDRFITRDTLSRTERSRRMGAQAVGFDDQTQSRLNLAMSDSSTYDKVIGARGKNFSAALGGGLLGGAVGKGSAQFGGVMEGVSIATMGAFGGESAKQYEFLTKMSDTFETAKLAGTISGSFEDMLAGKAIDTRTGKAVDRDTLETLASQYAVQAAKSGNKMDRLYGGKGKGGTGARDLEAARQRSQDGIKSFMKDFGTEAKIFGVFGGTGVSSYGAAGLGDKLNKDGRVRAKMMEFGRSLEALKDPSNKAKSDILLRKKKELIELLGPGSEEAEEIESMYSRASSDTAYRDKLIGSVSETGSLGELFQERALAEHIASEAPRAEKILEDLQSGSLKTSAEVRAKVERVADMTSRGDAAGRQAAIQDLMQTVMSDNKLSEDERSVIGKIGAGGTTFLDVLDTAFGKGKDKVQKLQGALAEGDSFTDAEMGKLKSGSTKDILDVLNAHDISVDAFKGSSADETSTQGTEKSYKEANQQFIDAVNKLVTRLEAAKVIEPDKGENTGGGDSNWWPW